MKRATILIYVLFAASAAAAAGTHSMLVLAGAGAAAAPAPQGATVAAIPLYRLYKLRAEASPSWEGVPGLNFYTVDAHEKEVSLKYRNYRDEGVAAYILPKPAHGTVPLYRLSGTLKGFGGTALTTKHFYTTSKSEVDNAVSKAGWRLDEVIGFVAPPDRGLPGTVPLYRLYRPTSVNSKTGAYGHDKTGDDDHFYTTRQAEKDQAMYQGGYKDEGVAAYVWPGPATVALYAPAGPLPDLSARQVEAEEFSVKAVIVNGGKANTGGAQLYAHLFLYDRAGKTLFSDGKFVGGMSPGQFRPVTFETGGRSLLGLRYQVKVDIANAVKESDESNNVTEMTAFHRQIKINVDPNAPARVPPPTFAITGVQPASKSWQRPQTTYRLTVSNWDAYDPSWFQPLADKAPAQCGDGPTKARMIVRFSLVKQGVAVSAGCAPLDSADALRNLYYVSPAPLADADGLRIALEDRRDRMRYSSETYLVGWFGLDKSLPAADCKYFLGRAGNYLCTTDSGMAACEGLKKQGKPIKCTRTGKPAK